MLRIGVNILFPIIGFMISFCLLLNKTIYEILFISLPWSLFFALNCYYFCCAIGYQITYFHIICYYLYLKLKIINEEIQERVKSKNSKGSIIDVLKNFYALYSEISIYNNQFWSKFIVSIYLIFIIPLSTVLYMLIFSSTYLIVKIIGIYSFTFALLIFIVMFVSAILINNQMKATYKLLNQYFLTFKQRRCANRVKVINL